MLNVRTMGNKDLVNSTLAFLSVLAMISVVLLALVLPRVVIAVPINTVNALPATLTVPNTCIPVLSNVLLTFPDTNAGQFASTANAENVINAGNSASNILVNGGNWVFGNNAFLQTNTLWSLASGGNIGTQLTNSITQKDTLQPVQASSGANVIFFGVNVPQGQTAATYVQTINVMLSC